jgi:hypothetical protein
MEDARKVGHCGVKIGAHHDAFLFVRVGARADGHRRCGRAPIDRNVWHPGRDVEVIAGVCLNNPDRQPK